MDKKRHIVFTGGGTGGHVFPLVSLIEHGQKDSDISTQCKMSWFGQAASLEQKVCTQQLANVEFVAIYAGKLRRYWNLRSIGLNIRDMLRVFVGTLQSLWYLWKMEVDVVFCKGGYVALPVCVAAKVLGKKIFIHESDRKPGLVNRVVAKWAEQVFVGFPGTFLGEEVVGQLLSDRLHISQVSEQDASTTSLPQVLVMGGAQGAQSIFRVVEQLLPQYPHMHFHVILGTLNSEFGRRLHKHENVTCYDFLGQEELARLYIQCDLSLTRAGVTSLAEQQLFAIKKAIIPLPWTGGDHQTPNAQWYVDHYGDVLLKQDAEMEDTISSFLDTYSTYKKRLGVVDLDALAAPKKRIWEMLLT